MHLMTHVSIVCLGCCVFHVPLCMQIHTTRGWSWEPHVSHMHSDFYSFALSSSLFFCLFSDHSFSFYVITPLAKNHWSLPNICLSLFTEPSLALVHVHATPTYRQSYLAFFRSQTMCKLFNIGTFLKLGLYMLHHCDKYPAYLRGLSTWGVYGRLARSRLTCTYNDGAKGIVIITAVQWLSTAQSYLSLPSL